MLRPDQSKSSKEAGEREGEGGGRGVTEQKRTTRDSQAARHAKYQAIRGLGSGSSETWQARDQCNKPPKRTQTFDWPRP